jgi:hypothetical protein
MKPKTISMRWWAWKAVDPVFAALAACAFSLSMSGLVIHWVGFGLWRTVGLWMLIGFDVILLTITFVRARKFPDVWWWFTFFCYITVGVIGWEIASCF